MKDQHDLKDLLEAVQAGRMDVEQGLHLLRGSPSLDIGHSKIDLHRTMRNGFPEVIYAEGKTCEQVGDLFQAMRGKSHILATRVPEATAKHVLTRFPDVVHDPLGRTLTHIRETIRFGKGSVGIVTAGTSDLGIAQEAKTTCELLGSRASIVGDVGVAGLHRLFDRMEEIRAATVLIVVAGMEGALASVIGGLVPQPVIAVPTSVGYGANMGGLAALLGMLTSCASGVSVVNIDNGFGAACAACRINNLLNNQPA